MPVAKITLYGPAQAPYTEKVRRALLLKGLKPERYGDSLRLEESVGRKARELAELYGLKPEEVMSSAHALVRPAKSR